MSNIKRFFSALVLLLVSVAAQAAGLPPIFAERIVSEVLLTSKPGVRILTDVTAVNIEYTTEATLRSFLQRLEWQQNASLRERLTEEFLLLEREFGEFRTRSGKDPKLTAGEVLSKEERAFLEAFANRALNVSAIDNLLLQSRKFFDIPQGRADLARARDEFLRGEGAARVDGPEVPRLPTELADIAGPNSNLPDLSILEEGFKFKMAERFRLYARFFKTFTLSDAEVRRMFGLAGKTFTEKDLVMVRKLNRLLDVLNEYSRMRLVIKAFSQERPMLYERLNAETAEATRQYLDGILSEADYLAARKLAAEKLRMNGIVADAERRMLNVVVRCKELGGGAFAGVKNRASIDIAEDNLRRIQQQGRDHSAALERLQAKEAQILSDRAATQSVQHRAALDTQLREISRSKLREQADIDLRSQREQSEAESLKKMYIDFVEAYDSLSIFVNLRRGRVNSEEARSFDLPDAFVPSTNEMQVWKEFYDRALYNATHELVLHETKAFFAAQVGATRQFVRGMNDMTGKYFGKRFTDSELGQEFLDYNRSVARVTIERMGKFLGLTLPPSIGTYYADKLWAYLFTEKMGAESATSGSEATTGGTTATGGTTGGQTGTPTGNGEDPNSNPAAGAPPSPPRRSTIPRPRPIRLEDPNTPTAQPSSGPN